jgi:hypothetical protein
LFNFNKPKEEAVEDAKYCSKNFDSCKYSIGEEDSSFTNKARYAEFAAFSGGIQGNSGSWM